MKEEKGIQPSPHHSNSFTEEVKQENKDVKAPSKRKKSILPPPKKKVNPSIFIQINCISEEERSRNT